MAFDRQVVEESFRKAKPILKDVVTKFYEYLAKDYPKTLTLFQGIDINRMKLETVGFLIDFIENNNEEQNPRKYFRLQNIFSKYKIDETIVDWGIHSFLRSLEYFFGDDWQGELSHNWIDALEDFKIRLLQKESAATFNPVMLPNLSQIPNLTLAETPSSRSTTMMPDQHEAMFSNKKPASLPTILPDVPPILPKHTVVEEMPNLELEMRLKFDSHHEETPISNHGPMIVEEEPKFLTREIEEVDLPQPIEIKNVLETPILQENVMKLEPNFKSEEVIQGDSREVLNIDGLGRIEIASIELPESVQQQIQLAAEEMVKRVIKKQLETAFENELKEHLQNGISDFLKKSS